MSVLHPKTNTLEIIALAIYLRLPLEYPLLTADLETQQETIEKVVSDYFGSNSPMNAVVACESGFRQYVGTDVLISPTHDLGAFQVNLLHDKEATALGFDIRTFSGNLLYADYLYKTQGLSPWKSSSSCWQPRLALSG